MENYKAIIYDSDTGIGYMFGDGVLPNHNRVHLKETQSIFLKMGMVYLT